MEKQIIVNCVKDNSFEQTRRVVECCYTQTILEKENVFYVETSVYEEYYIGQYYTICPNCGYIILLDENQLPEEMKLSARKLKDEDPLLFRKNNLKSELIHLDRILPKVKARTLF